MNFHEIVASITNGKKFGGGLLGLGKIKINVCANNTPETAGNTNDEDVGTQGNGTDGTDT